MVLSKNSPDNGFGLEYGSSFQWTSAGRMVVYLIALPPPSNAKRAMTSSNSSSKTMTTVFRPLPLFWSLQNLDLRLTKTAHSRVQSKKKPPFYIRPITLQMSTDDTARFLPAAYEIKRPEN